MPCQYATTSAYRAAQTRTLKISARSEVEGKVRLKSYA